MNQQEAIKTWKDLGVARANFEFSCGGDSMNDYSVTLEDANGNSIESAELRDYFENETFRNVQFYEASDGHYMGEAGTVEITLNEDDEEPFFDYFKNAQSEWSETKQSILVSKKIAKKTETERALQMKPHFMIHMTYAAMTDLKKAAKKTRGIVICPRANASLADCRSAATVAAGFSDLYTALPATKVSAPARAPISIVSSEIPPSS